MIVMKSMLLDGLGFGLFDMLGSLYVDTIRVLWSKMLESLPNLPG